MPDSSDIKWEFYQKVTRKSSSQLNSYWARKLFSGQAEAPIELKSATQMLRKVASTEGSVGYVDASLIDDSVKVLYTINN